MNSSGVFFTVKGTKHIYSVSALHYYFGMLVLCLSISILSDFIPGLNYILETNIVLFTPLHLCGSHS